MTPTHILQREERERRIALGLPPEESWAVMGVYVPIKKVKSILGRLNTAQKHRWRNIKKGKL